MFKLNLKIALRNLWKNKAYTLINAGGLAIGLASCLILMLYVSYEWSFDKQFTNHRNNYIVYQNAEASGKIFSWAWTPNAMADEVREKIPGVKYASHASYPSPKLISHGDKKFNGKAVFADASFLKILDYPFLKGNSSQVLKEVNTIILTRSFAEKLFGSEDPVHKMVKLDNAELLKVEGIIEDIPANNTIRFDYLMPWALYEKTESWMKEKNWGNNMCQTLVQLQSPDLLDRVNAEMKGIYKRNFKESNSEALLFPMDKWHLYNDFQNGKSVGGKIDQLRIFVLLAFCILLIACVNFMNLSTARSEKRAKEVGVRKAIGSSRKALIGQFLLESILLSVMGTAIAFILAEISLPYFNHLLHIELAIAYHSRPFWLVLTGLMLFTGLVAGSYPAIYLSSFEPVTVLKGFKAKLGNSVSVRKALVVFQFVFAVCLIICTTVIYQQLNFIKNKPIGYNKDNLVQIAVQGNMQQQHTLNRLKEQLLKSGAATDVTFFSKDISTDGNNTTSIDWPGKAANQTTMFNTRGIGYDFTRTIGTRLMAGREFSTAYPADSNKVLLNESAVKVMGLKQPVGTVINWAGIDLTVVGVIEDFVVASAYQKVDPMIFYHWTRDDVAFVLARLNPEANMSSSLARIDAFVQDIEPNFPVERTFVNEAFAEKYSNEQLLGTLSNWFGGFAIFISCMGLLGLALFMAEQHKKEIGVRKVLGANTLNIITLLNKDFIKLVAIANIIAFPLAYVIIHKWLSGYEYRISISVLPFIMAVCLSVIIAILTVSLQTFKVAKANPIDALKYE